MTALTPPPSQHVNGPLSQRIPGLASTVKNARPRPAGTKDATFAEASVFASVPIGPLCDARSLLSAPPRGSSPTAPLERTADETGQHGWSYRHMHGEVRSPLFAPDESAVVQMGYVLDVYAGLLVELERAGYPADGRVRVGRLEFLRRIQWADDRGNVGGSWYERLDAAIAYLYEMRVTSSALECFEPGDFGLPTSGALDFRVLQGHGRVSELQQKGVVETNREGAGHRADDLVVYFSTLFVRLLQAQEHRVTYRLSHYLSFRRGTPRALYRYVTWLSTQRLSDGTITIDLDDLLAGIGSTLRGVTPARVRQLLKDAPELLVALGVLHSAPKYTSTTVGGTRRHSVTFRPGTPPTEQLREVLYSTLVAWGVEHGGARRYVDKAPEWAAKIVAATTLGMLEVRRTLPAMVVDYLKDSTRPLHVDELPRFCPTGNAPRRTATHNEAMRYLAEQLEESMIYLTGSATDYREQLRTAYSGVNRPDWVVDGLVFAAAARSRGAWSLHAFLNAQGLRWR